MPTIDDPTTGPLSVSTGPAGAPEIWPMTGTVVVDEFCIGDVSLLLLASRWDKQLYVVTDADFLEGVRVAAGRTAPDGQDENRSLTCDSASLVDWRKVVVLT